MSTQQMIPVQTSFPPERLRHMRKVMRECKPITVDPRWLDNWNRSQQRQAWVYNVIAGAVLVLILFVVAGGCR